MRLQVFFCVCFSLLLLNACSSNSSYKLIYTREVVVFTTTSTPVVKQTASATRLVPPTREPSKSNASINTSKTNISQPLIDINGIITNFIGGILVLIIAGLFTRSLWLPLITNRHSPLKSKKKRRNLARYLQDEKIRILDVNAPGSIGLKVKDIVEGRRLFIPPLWKNLHSTTPSIELVEHLITTVSLGKRVLLLGEPGQGKTIVLKQVFTIMVDRFLHHSRDLVPLYIPLREFTYSTSDALDLLWAYLRNRFPLEFEDFIFLVRNNKIVFLFDGFDEIKGELTQHSINERASSNMFSYPSILSCRRHFYDLYLSMSAIQELYSIQVEFIPLALTEVVKQYINSFCDMKRDIAPQDAITSPEKIVELIQGNQELQDLVQRPLLLVMILDIFTDPKERGESEWNIAKLYQKYTEKWLQNEAAKPDSVLRQDEKATLIQEIAWSTHRKRAANPYGLYQTATFTRGELSGVLRHFPAFYQEQDIKFAQLTDDICLRTFLIGNEGISYYFIHKSFQEYYVAKYIYDSIRHKGDDLDYVSQALQELIPMEVSAFLKGMLNARNHTKYDMEQMVNTLIKVYQGNGIEDDHAAIIRQNASYYLTVLGKQKAVQFLEQTYQQETNKWVQRGIMVGLALNCRRTDILERYIAIVNTDPDAASINIGYHLVHYGDQALEEGYYDKGGEICAGTVRAIVHHLKSESYKSYWILDILTLRMLLESRGVAVLSADPEYQSFLQEFLSRPQRAR